MAAEDVVTLLALLDELDKRKLVVGAVSVGALRVVFAGVREELPVQRPLSEREAKLEKLRRASVRTFGRQLPDDELEKLEGAL